jgi:hypothetical protein
MVSITRSPADHADANSAERRQFRRKAVIWAAKLDTPNGILECVTLDLSLSGARLRLADNVGLQQKVTLLLEKFGGFQGEVVWETAVEVGVQFSDSPDLIAKRFGNVLPLGAA